MTRPLHKYAERMVEAMGALDFVRVVLLARGPVESYDEALARLEECKRASAREVAEAAHELRCARAAAVRREALKRRNGGTQHDR